jgi:hypothetical protein
MAANWLMNINCASPRGNQNNSEFIYLLLYDHMISVRFSNDKFPFARHIVFNKFYYIITFLKIKTSPS